MTKVIAAALLAIGLIVAGWFVGYGFSHRHTIRYVTVKGLAEDNVKANIALWQIQFDATGNDLANVESRVQSDGAAVTAFLQKHHIGTADVAFHRVEVTDRAAREFGSQQFKTRFVVTGTIMVRTHDVNAVAAAAQDTSSLIAQGVVLGSPNGNFNAGPDYLFTGIEALKPAMITEATRNARVAAAQFARDTDSRLGGIIRANQGVFQILPRDQAPMLQQDKQIDKTVRVVSTLVYSLRS